MDRNSLRRQIEGRIAELTDYIQRAEEASDLEALWIKDLLKTELAKEELKLALLDEQSRT